MWCVRERRSSAGNLGVMVHVYSPSTWQVDSRRLGVQNQPNLYSEFGSSLDFMSLFKKIQNKQKIRSSAEQVHLSRDIAMLIVIR